MAGYGTVFLPSEDIYKCTDSSTQFYIVTGSPSPKPLTKTCPFLSLRLNILLFDDALSTANVAASLRLEDDAKDLEAVTVT
jgi:hypothetical protein